MNDATDAAEVVGNFEEQARIVNTLRETNGLLVVQMEQRFDSE